MHFLRRGDSNLQRRFVLRVLLPPFVALLALSLLGFWQLDKQLRIQAIGTLSRASETVAAKLEREFKLRETVLRRTGEELFIIKSEYQADKKKLEDNRSGCRDYIRQKATYVAAPNGVCDPFLEALVASGPRQQVVEDQYVKIGQTLNTSQNQRLNERLSAFKQFFPEALGLLVVDQNGQVASSALSGAFRGSVEAFLPTAKLALTNPVEGKLETIENFELSVFAYPIAGGAVLAVYDVNNPNFIKQSWESAPIDRKNTTTIILDAEGNTVYPDIRGVNSFKDFNTHLRTNSYADVILHETKHVAVGSEVGASKWLVVVVSPRAVVLGSLRDAQLAAVVVLGLLIVGFLWVGTYFVQRIVGNLVHLVRGANIFGSGKLDHKIVLHRADKELDQLAETMNTMARQIDENEKAMDQKNKDFISVATHELRAPMTAIIGYLSMFKEKHTNTLDEGGQKIIEEVYYGTSRLRDLVNDMLTIARLEGSRNDAELVPIQVDKIMRDIVKTMSVVAKISKITLTYDDSQAQTVMANEERLRIIINNLISNAIKYNRAGGTVSVSYSVKDDHLITSVADTGLGIPEDQKARMFEKFFRVSGEDRKNITGTGLGMYITSSYVQAMHGKIWFTSTHGKGTTFYFSLPLAKAA